MTMIAALANILAVHASEDSCATTATTGWEDSVMILCCCVPRLSIFVALTCRQIHSRPTSRVGQSREVGHLPDLTARIGELPNG